MPDITVSSDIDTFMQAADKGAAKRALESLITASPGATENDYNPTGLSTASSIRLTPSAESVITGIVAPASFGFLAVRNEGSFGVSLINQSASSTAANRFNFGRDVYLAPGQGVVLSYDTTDSRWKLVARTGITTTDRIMVFGDGSDGDVTISSGTTTISRDTYYRNLTISGTGALVTNGWRVFVQQTLDLSAAPAGAIRWNGNAGSNAVTFTGGSAGAILNSNSVGGSQPGQAGASGGTGVGPQPTNQGGLTTWSNGTAGGGGAGGDGTSAGGAGRTTAVGTAVWRNLSRLIVEWIFGTVLPNGSQVGQAGSAGGGDGVVSGGGGGGSASGGGVIAIYARTILRGAGTAVGAIQAIGGAGGAGASRGSGDTGGGGGGAGASGGFIYIAYEALVGTTATNALDVSGGAGGAGGAGFGTGKGGGGGGGGGRGRAVLVDISTATVTVSISASGGTNGTAQSGTISGVAGGAATTGQANL